MINLFEIHWARLDNMMSAPILILLIIGLIYQTRSVKLRLNKLAHHTLVSKIFHHFSPRRPYIKSLCMGLSFIAIFIALLQPQWGRKEEIIEQEGRDLFILLDISRSMLAEDMKPNRLAFAKLKIRQLLEELPTDRVGLILFSDHAIVQCPLTADHQAFNLYLQEVNEYIVGPGSTTIDKALTKVISIFKNIGKEKNKLVLLLTDGEDFSTNLGAAEQTALQEHVHLFAIGVGTQEGAPIPILDIQGKKIRHEIDATGAVVMSALNEQQLESLCSKLHGIYIPASYDQSDINRIVSHVETFEKEKYHEQKVSLYEDQYPWPLSCAAFLLALEWIL